MTKKRESYKSANAANKARRAPKKPDAERCSLCGAMCTDPTEVSRHHEDDCSRHPDNRPQKRHNPPHSSATEPDAEHFQIGPRGTCACGNLWPCTQMTGPGKTKRPKKPRPPWPRGPSVIPPPEPRKNPGLFNEETGMAWEHTHETTGSSGCNACFVEDTAPREGGIPWATFTNDLIAKLGFMPRYPGLTDEQHLRELIGPTWAEDAKRKWVVNWTVDGYLARRPHLKAKPRDLSRSKRGIELVTKHHCPSLICKTGLGRHMWTNRYAFMIAETAYVLWDCQDCGEQMVEPEFSTDGVGAEHPRVETHRWSVFVNKRGVHFAIDHQSFMLRDDYDPEDGWTKEAYYKWYAKQLTIAFKRLMSDG